jgi:hypothetical protein
LVVGLLCYARNPAGREIRRVRNFPEKHRVFMELHL